MKYPLPSIFIEQKIVKAPTYISVPEYKGLTLKYKDSARKDFVRWGLLDEREGSLTQNTFADPIKIQITNTASRALPAVICSGKTLQNFGNSSEIVISSVNSNQPLTNVLLNLISNPIQIGLIRISIHLTRNFPVVTFNQTSSNGFTTSRPYFFRVSPMQQQSDIAEMFINEPFGGIGSEINLTMSPNSTVTLDLFPVNQSQLQNLNETQEFGIEEEADIDDILDETILDVTQSVSSRQNARQARRDLKARAKIQKMEIKMQRSIERAQRRSK